MKKSIEASTNQSLLAIKIISTNLTLNIIHSHITLCLPSMYCLSISQERKTRLKIKVLRTISQLICTTELKKLIAQKLTS